MESVCRIHQLLAIAPGAGESVSNDHETDDFAQPRATEVNNEGHLFALQPMMDSQKIPKCSNAQVRALTQCVNSYDRQVVELAVFNWMLSTVQHLRRTLPSF